MRMRVVTIGQEPLCISRSFAEVLVKRGQSYVGDNRRPKRQKMGSDF